MIVLVSCLLAMDYYRLSVPGRRLTGDESQTKINKQTKAVLLSFRFPLSYQTGSNIFFIKGDLIVNVNTCERL